MQYHYLFLFNQRREALYRIGVEKNLEQTERFGSLKVTEVSRIQNLAELFHQYSSNNFSNPELSSLNPALVEVATGSSEYQKIVKYVEIRHIFECKPCEDLATVLNEALEQRRIALRHVNLELQI